MSRLNDQTHSYKGIIMVIALIYDRNNTHPDLLKDMRGSYKRGYIVELFEDGTSCVNNPASPFVILKVPDILVEDAQNYINNWTRHIDYEIVNQNLALDGWRVRVFATNPAITDQGVGAGKITRTMVETYLNKWNATVFTFADNSVTFDISVYNAIKSEGFWNANISQIIFSEIAYDQTTGLHTIQIDYSGTSYKREKVINKITQMKGTIISEVGKVIQFTITRQIVLNTFKHDIKKKVETILYCRQYYLPSDLVTTIENNGRVYTITKAELLAFIHNRVTE